MLGPHFSQTVFAYLIDCSKPHTTHVRYARRICKRRHRIRCALPRSGCESLTFRLVLRVLTLRSKYACVHLFCLNQAGRLGLFTVLTRIYGKEAINGHNYSKTLTSVAFAGTVVGMLVFGYLSDKLGRKFGMVCGLPVLLIVMLRNGRCLPPASSHCSRACLPRAQARITVSAVCSPCSAPVGASTLASPDVTGLNLYVQFLAWDWRRR